MIVPVQAQGYAMLGFNDLARTIEMARQRINPRLTLRGILVTQFDGRTIAQRAVLGHIVAEYGARYPLFRTTIKQATCVHEAALEQLPVLRYDPKSASAAAYRQLAAEVAERPASRHRRALLSPPAPGSRRPRPLHRRRRKRRRRLRRQRRCRRVPVAKRVGLTLVQRAYDTLMPNPPGLGLRRRQAHRPGPDPAPPGTAPAGAMRISRSWPRHPPARAAAADRRRVAGRRSLSAHRRRGAWRPSSTSSA